MRRYPIEFSTGVELVDVIIFEDLLEINILKPSRAVC
jgi:hypothetical protein